MARMKELKAALKKQQKLAGKQRMWEKIKANSQRCQEMRKKHGVGWHPWSPRQRKWRQALGLPVDEGCPG